MVKWVSKADDEGFRLEAKFLTYREIQRELEGSGFARNPDDVDGAGYYIRYWPDGYHAIARVNPRSGAGRIKVAVSYFDPDGRKFHKTPLGGTLRAGKEQQVLMPRQPPSENTRLFSFATDLLVQIRAAARSALGRSKSGAWLEQ